MAAALVEARLGGLDDLAVLDDVDQRQTVGAEPLERDLDRRVAAVDRAVGAHEDGAAALERDALLVLVAPARAGVGADRDLGAVATADAAELRHRHVG